ncbi:outer membrane lipoprotein carrier protein [Gillisia sp. Hel_I_86]|uniref:LolA family protein n=1 Tax=Gillisia sp. Hel_I_86 TaxID=1249981 RepID=UPI00119AB4D8|nr:outer membrane lipoprotein carrier protein LolA [Gillisia sp. Hel_I_86]TVZ27928.1 outer membrane lipoprotein carrier protein [Gillisia sp. Hel_I_86]
MHILRLAVFLISVATFAQTPLTEAETVKFKEIVSKRSDALESLSSEFIQTKYIKMMKGTAISNGKLYYLAPDILKWEYRRPYNYKILFKANKLLIDDDGYKSVTDLKSNKLFEKLVTLISGSINGKLLEDQKNYEVSYFKTTNLISAVIVPKDSGIREMFNQIILLFDRNFVVITVRLMEASGDYTEIDFKNIRFNQPIHPAVFQN